MNVCFSSSLLSLQGEDILKGLTEKRCWVIIKITFFKITSIIVFKCTCIYKAHFTYTPNSYLRHKTSKHQ